MILAAHLKPPAPPVGSSVGASAGDGGTLSFTQMVSKSAMPPTLKMQMRYLVDVEGELGFIFTKPKMSKAAKDIVLSLS